MPLKRYPNGLEVIWRDSNQMERRGRLDRNQINLPTFNEGDEYRRRG
jgi:hypothetical protein